MDLIKKLKDIQGILDKLPKSQIHYPSLIYSVLKSNCDTIIRMEAAYEIMRERGEEVDDGIEVVNRHRASAEESLSQLHDDLMVKLSNYLNE